MIGSQLTQDQASLLAGSETIGCSPGLERNKLRCLLLLIFDRNQDSAVCISTHVLLITNHERDGVVEPIRLGAIKA
jgi:hypothetical protein